jgi:hypothetical protein
MLYIARPHNFLIEKSENLPRNMLSSRFLMIHYPGTCSKDNEADTSRWQELIDPFLQLRQTDVEAGGNDSTFVQSTVKLNDDFS